jgi:hypothetical protein
MLQISASYPNITSALTPGTLYSMGPTYPYGKSKINTVDICDTAGCNIITTSRGGSIPFQYQSNMLVHLDSMLFGDNVQTFSNGQNGATTVWAELGGIDWIQVFELWHIVGRP